MSKERCMLCGVEETSGNKILNLITRNSKTKKSICSRCRKSAHIINVGVTPYEKIIIDPTLDHGDNVSDEVFEFIEKFAGKILFFYTDEKLIKDGTLFVEDKHQLIAVEDATFSLVIDGNFDDFCRYIKLLADKGAFDENITDEELEIKTKEVSDDLLKVKEEITNEM